MQQQPILNVVPNPGRVDDEATRTQAPEPSDRVPDSPKEAPGEKSKPRRPLPTPRLNVKRQLDLLRAYGVASGDDAVPVHYARAAELAGIHPNTSTLCNAFFYEINLAKRVAGRIVASEVLRDYARAYEWDPATAAHKLAPVLRKAWFATTLEMHLRMRPLNERDGLRLLGEEAHAGPEHGQQLRMCLEFLEAAGIIERAGEMIRLAASDDVAPAATGRPANGAEAPAVFPEPAAAHAAALAPSPVVATTQLVNGAIEFQCSVRVTMADLAGWRPEQISAFFEGMAKVISAKNGSSS